MGYFPYKGSIYSIKVENVSKWSPWNKKLRPERCLGLGISPTKIFHQNHPAVYQDLNPSDQHYAQNNQKVLARIHWSKTSGSGDFTGIGSAYRPDPTIGSGLTPDNKGTGFLCLVLTSRSPRKLEARGDLKWSRLTHGCDRPRIFHFKIGLRHLLHMSCKSRIQHGMISI